MDHNHRLIKELLPLYFDGMVSEETRDIMEKHIGGCQECQAELAELASDGGAPLYPLPEGEEQREMAGYSQPSFISRLKRFGLTIAGLILVSFLVFTAASWNWGHEAAEEEKLKHDQELIQMDNDLVTLSPPREAILKKSGVKLEIIEKRFMPEQSILKYRYSWEDPNIDYIQEDIYWPNHLIAMDLTHNEVLERIENVSITDHQLNEESWILSGIEGNTETIGIELPNFAVFYKPQDFQVSLNPHGETAINKQITVNGIDFLVEKAEVTEKRINIHYQQLGEIPKTGLYELSFNIFDANGKHWSKEPQIDFQIQKNRITGIPLFRDMKGPLMLHLEHAVLVVPGMHYKFSVK